MTKSRRSVTVVFPASMWAMIPIFRILPMAVRWRLTAALDGTRHVARQHRLDAQVIEGLSVRLAFRKFSA